MSMLAKTPKWEAVSRESGRSARGAKKLFSKINYVDETDRRKRRINFVSITLVVTTRDPKTFTDMRIF
jgi:hypothetical protein